MPTLPCSCCAPGSRGSAAGASGGLPQEPCGCAGGTMQVLGSHICTLCADSPVLGETWPAEVGTCPWASLALSPSWDGHCRGCRVPSLVWDHPECKALAPLMLGTAVTPSVIARP